MIQPKKKPTPVESLDDAVAKALALALMGAQAAAANDIKLEDRAKLAGALHVDINNTLKQYASDAKAQKYYEELTGNDG